MEYTRNFEIQIRVIWDTNKSTIDEVESFENIEDAIEWLQEEWD